MRRNGVYARGIEDVDCDRNCEKGVDARDAKSEDLKTIAAAVISQRLHRPSTPSAKTNKDVSEAQSLH